MKEKKFLNQNGIEIEEQIKLSGHKWHVSCLGFSINGVYFASGSWDKQIRIWDLRVLTSSKTLGDDDKGHKAPVTSVSWFPNIEFLLASGSADNTIRIWNSESGERLSLLEGHTEWVLGTSFNYNGTVLSSASWDKNIGIWDINTLTLSQMLDGHSAGVWSTMFRTCSGDSILCSGSEDSSVKIWDLRTQNKWLHVANLVGVHDDAVKCCAWSPCGNYIAAGSSDTRVSIWDIRENRAVNILQGHSEMVTHVKFLPNETSKGHQVLASAGDISCRFWDIFSQQRARELLAISQHDIDYEVECLEFSGDGTLLATGGRDNKIVLSTISINEDELHKYCPTEKQFVARDQGFKRNSRVSAKSSAVLVDNAVLQNELLETEKAKQIAKQTVKIKSNGESDILQSKLLELKSSKGVTHSEQRLDELYTQNKEADKMQRSVPLNKRQPIVYPERDYDDVEVTDTFEQTNAGSNTISQSRGQTSGQKSDGEDGAQQVGENPASLYESGLILGFVKNPPEERSGVNADLASRTALDSNYDIDEVANEMIRLSDEQQYFDARL